MRKNICIVDRRLMLLLSLLLLPASCQNSDWVTYHYYSERKSWSEAQKYCREHHTDLASFTNEKENEYKVDSNSYTWMGLYRIQGGEWKWSEGEEVPMFTPMPWFPGEPQDNQDCGLKMKNSINWGNHQCVYKYPFVCSTVNLVLVKENKTWEEALDHCWSLGAGEHPDPAVPKLHLATLITPTEHRGARERAQKASSDEVWTGLRFLAGHWLWVGGEAVQYETLPSCPALKSCGVLEKSGNASFQIRECTERRNFLCYRKS